MRADGNLGMHGRLEMRVIRVHPTIRQRLADAISNLLRRLLPS